MPGLGSDNVTAGVNTGIAAQPNVIMQPINNVTNWDTADTATPAASILLLACVLDSTYQRKVISIINRIGSTGIFLEYDRIRTKISIIFAICM